MGSAQTSASFDEILQGCLATKTETAASEAVAPTPHIFDSLLGWERIELFAMPRLHRRGRYEISPEYVPAEDPYCIEISLLSTEAQHASAHLQSLGARWKTRISTKILKREWRRLARSYHPDLNPGIAHGVFAELRHSHALLLAALVDENRSDSIRS